MPSPAKPPPIPASFTAKKSRILSSLTQSTDAYTDNSPKGSVDAQIQDLIGEVNEYEGLVTTSSCAGRVAVFVEGGGRGGKDERRQGRDGDQDEDEDEDDGDGDDGASSVRNGGPGDADDGQTSRLKKSSAKAATTTSPGGKGGGRWLYVSHDPIPLPPTSPSIHATSGPPPDQQDGYFSSLFNLPSTPSSHSPSPSYRSQQASSPPRLIHLSFSPFILHIHCATLHHARPLLAAAINAGFRESGVQSLRILEPSEAEKGVVVAIRTAGLGFETVVGVVEAGDDGREEVMRAVSEEYLGKCASVINQRFRWNEERRERFRRELRGAFEREGIAADGETGAKAWEDKDERRRRKREEGLARQRRTQEASAEKEAEGKGDGAAGSLSMEACPCLTPVEHHSQALIV